MARIFPKRHRFPRRGEISEQDVSQSCTREDRFLCESARRLRAIAVLEFGLLLLGGHTSAVGVDQDRVTPQCSERFFRPPQYDI